MLPVKLTTTVTSGVIANSNQVNKGNVASFATRFASTFVEYRMVQARMKVRLFSSTNPGIFQMFWDEKSIGAPTAAEASERATEEISCAATDRTVESLWTCADPLDLQYQVMTTAITPVTFKTYTDNSTYGASIVATDYAEVSGFIRFQFRGLQGV
jgi:hypothetical protein